MDFAPDAELVSSRGTACAVRDGVRHKWWFRVIRFALVTLVTAELGYVATANAWLNWGGVQHALRATDDIRVTFRSAWTLWPGRVHVNEARILFQDHNLEWSLDAPRLDAELALIPLLSKTLHATRVRGEGLVFRVRLRVVAADAELASTLALPPIPEFRTPALVPAYVPAPPRTDLWRVHAEDVDVGVVEIWAQQLRYQGVARAGGAFRLHAGQSLVVGPASMDLRSGQLRAGNRLLAGSLSGHVTCVVHPFFVNVPVGREVFRYISATLELHGEDVNLEPLTVLLPPGAKLATPGARLDLRLDAEHGVLTDKTHVELQGPTLSGVFRGWTFNGKTFGVGAHVAADGSGEVNVRFEHAGASPSGERGSQVTVTAAHLAVASPSVDLSGDWGLARVDGAVTGLDVPVLSRFDDLTKRHQLRLRGGSARVDASGRYAGGSIRGEGRAIVSKARGSFESVNFELDGSARLSLGRGKTEALSEDRVDLTVDARTLAVVVGATRVEASNASIKGHARLRDGRGTGSVRATAKRLSLVEGVVRADARRVDLASEVSLSRSKLTRGSLELSLPSVRVRVGATSVVGAAKLAAKAKDLDLLLRSGTAHATLTVRKFSASSVNASASCPWLSVPRATLRGELGFATDGQAQVHAVADIGALRARWDDFLVTGDARLESRYQQRSNDAISLDVNAKRLHMTSGKNPREGWEAKIPELELMSKLRRSFGQLSGTVRVRARGVQGRLGRTPVHADLGSTWRLSMLDLEHGAALASGTVSIDHAGLDAGSLRVRDWWGRVTLPTLSVLAGANVDASGEFGAQFRDGLPALGMFAASGDLPGWVPSLFPLEELEATGEFRRSCRMTDIVVKNASGGPLASAGRIQSSPADTRAAFLLQLQSPLRLSAGIVSHGDEVHVGILAGNDWLLEQSRTLDGWALNATCESAAPVSCKMARAEEPVE